MTYFILLTFLFWRSALFFIAFVGEKILKFSPTFPYSDIYLLPSGLPKWLWSFANFDGVHYLTIAQSGYFAQFTQAFFPLYPAILSLVHSFLSIINPVITGLLISNILFLLSLFMFKKLLALDYKEDMIKWILLFLLIFPTAFFFGSLYTESLFLFLILASFYAARKKHWLTASIVAALASSTKLIGIFLLPALLWEWQTEKIKNQKSKIKNTNTLLNFLRFLRNILLSPLSLIPVGLLSYMLYLQINFGDFLYFWHAQPSFGAARSGGGIILLPQVLWRYIKILTSVSYTSYAFWIPFLELVFTLGALILLIMAFRKKVRFSYLIFSFLAVLTPTFTGTFSSMPRYILSAFPIFLVLGLIKNKLLKLAIIFSFGLLLTVLTVLFTSGRWVG